QHLSLVNFLIFPYKLGAIEKPGRFHGIVRGRLRGLRRFPGREHPDQGGCRIIRGSRHSARICRGCPCRSIVKRLPTLLNSLIQGLYLRLAKYSAEIFTSSSVALFALATINAGGPMVGSELFRRPFL